MPTPKLNEETIKNRYLLPYLTALGFNPSELAFEGRVTVRIGRSEFRASQKTGIYDILVSRGHDTLFLVEAKGEADQLTEEDAKQGISYASLLRPIPPYVLVTNCNESRLYETISGKEITGAKISPDSDFTVSLPSERIEEAIAHFLGLSEENLAAFSRAEATEELIELIGSKADPSRKFIPDLFVERQALIESFERFAAAPEVLFAVVGDSGSGKTCCLCDLTQKLLARQQPVLFYRGINLKGSLLEAIATDFNWTFSERVSEVTLVRRLTRILGDDRKLIVVVDGIDEWEYEGRRQDLLSTAKHMTRTSINLVVSCKAGAWQGFTTGRSIDTGLHRYIYRESENEVGFVLQPMNGKEFHFALENYREFYGVGRGMEDVAFEESKRSPFFMRVMFEVAQKKRSQFITLSSVDFFEEYLDQAIKRLQDPDDGLVFLLAIARDLFLKKKERLTDLDLVDLQARASHRDVLRELLEFQLLEKSGANAGMHISFYFSLLRDYLVAFRVERWQAATEEEFQQALGKLDECATHQEALAFFYRYASEDKQRLVDSPARERVAKLLKLYDTVLSTDLAPIRHRFVPHTKGRIGYVGAFDPTNGQLGFPEFRELNESQRGIRLLPMARVRLYDSNLPHLIGGKGLIGIPGIRQDDSVADYVLNEAIGAQLREIIDDGLLDESTEPRLAVETVLALVSGTSTEYGGEPHPMRRCRRPNLPDRMSDLFPLSLGEVRTWLKYKLLYQHLHEERVEEKKASGEIPITWRDDGTSSYSPNLTYQDMVALDQRIKDNLDDKSDKEVRELAVRVREDLRKLDQRLTAALDVLADCNLTEIESETFPERDELTRWPHRPYHIEDVLCAFLARVLPLAFEIFTGIVKHNFPTLYKCFPSMQWRPITAVAKVCFTKVEKHYWKSATIYICEGTSSEDRFIVAPRKAVTTSFRRDPWVFSVQVGDETFIRRESEEDCLGQRHVDLDRLFRRQYLERSWNFSQGIPPTLRVLVYDWLRQELPVVFLELCNKYGVEMKKDDWTFFPRSR